MNIIVEVRSVYGNDTVYPVCKKAKHFAAIAGQRTLTRATLAHIKALGYTVDVSTPSAVMEVNLIEPAGVPA